MSGMRPQPQVCQNFLNDVGLVNKGDDAHGAPTPLTQQGIGLIDLLDQLGPALFEKRRARRWGNLDNSGGRCVLSLLFGLLAFPPIDVTEPTIIAEKMFVDTVYECSKS